MSHGQVKFGTFWSLSKTYLATLSSQAEKVWTLEKDENIPRDRKRGNM
jgi:hypothetical protein